jgi:hypothetical protein
MIVRCFNCWAAEDRDVADPQAFSVGSLAPSFMLIAYLNSPCSVSMKAWAEAGVAPQRSRPAELQSSRNQSPAFVDPFLAMRGSASLDNVADRDRSQGVDHLPS